MKLLTDLQIFDCELHKNAFGGPTGGAVLLLRPPSRYMREEREGRGRGRKWLGIGRRRKERDKRTW